MINNGGSATVEGCEFVDCQQPVRAGGKTGSFVVRKCSFRGRSTGPRFNGGVTVQFENNVVEGATYGLRVYGDAQATIRNNQFRPSKSGGTGILLDDNARARLSGNHVEGAAKGGVVVRGKAQADLGGGSVAVIGNAQASPGGNRLVQNEPADLINETQGRISAKHNQWDHATASAVMSTDVRGLADVEPIGGK
jgi:nitrous oxidase accessory protein NosD